MKTKAFTLIEVLVTMTIISIMLGMLFPSVWRFWENEEIATTRERMREIKKGLVGDRNLIQNGVRYHYGFVGDNGELPFGNNTTVGGIAYLAARPDSGYPHWNGPYLTGLGNDWNRDAWRRYFRYTLSKDAYGRYVAAEIRSAGPNGIFGDSDDIVDSDLQVTEREVTPTNRIQGNFLLGFTNLTTSKPKHINYATRLMISFRDVVGGGISTVSTSCKNYGIDLAKGESRPAGFSNFTTLLTTAGGVPLKLPIGQITIQEQFFKTSGCGGTPIDSDSMTFFVSEGLQIVNINLPAIYATVP